MTSASELPEKEFFQLAAKVLTGTASSEERSKLDARVHDNPRLRKAFEHMQTLVSSDKDDRFLTTAIRFAFRKATPEETKEIASLETSNPKLWQRCCFIQEVFEGLAREAAVSDNTWKESMPGGVRKLLLAQLAKKQSKPRRRGSLS